MKRTLKIIRNQFGKVLYRLFIKFRRFTLLPSFVKIFPKEHYRAASQLLSRGYLNLAYEVIKDYAPKENEKHIKERILSMMAIKEEGVEIEPVAKKSIDHVSVLFAVHNSLPFDKAGYALRTQMLASNLQKQGVHVTVATRPGYPWDLQKHRHLRAHTSEEQVDNVSYIRLSDGEKIFKKGEDFRYINTYAEELVRVATEKHISILHGHSNYLNGLAAIEASNRLKIPSIYEIRGLWHVTRLTKDPNFRTAGMFKYEEEMKKGAAKAADAVVTISQALKKLIVSWGVEAEKVHVIPNAVDTTLFTPRPKSQRLIEKYQLENRVVVGFIGSLTAYEGLYDLVEVVDDLISDGYALSLIIVGDGDEKAKLEKYVDSPNIILTGGVPFAKVQEYYSVFDICAYPRKNYEVCHYVPPLKILEAMATKKAVIVSDFEPMVEMVEDKKTGLVCKADDKESLKESIMTLYSNQTMKEEIANNAFEWVVKNRTWNAMASEYIKLYSSFK